MDSLIVNENKKENIKIDSDTYLRFAIKTHIITDKDDICNVAEQYAKKHLQKGDILFITEKIVACTQGRAIPMKDIKPGRLAKFLCKFVLKTPHGIGLGIPETMEMALRECGTIRILFAAAISAIGKVLGKRGWFYNIAGYRARSIDGPCDCTIPPYNEYVVLGPAEPDYVARKISYMLGGVSVIITDINDLDGQILGAYPKNIDRELMVKILKDNPLGQERQQTPMGIIRKAENHNKACLHEGELIFT
ncbi:MAG: coenzyme F420-0:L-glutamate ligase [Clostridia bacterium]|nr:coenzyme F420-0:L-glutamate ligase [Clostridia bacterium]